MASGSQDKSITGGMSIPNWMKQKIGDRYDLDDSAFSPPSQDDNFFYIRYPKTTSRPPSETNYHRINKYLESQGSIGATATATEQSSTAMASSTNVTKALTGQTVAPQVTPGPKLALDFDPDEPPPNLSHRRGSKSLPASPLSSPNSSPKFGRKNMSALQNRFFTAAFPQPKSDSNQGYSGWLLSGLLGPREQAAGETLPPISESPGKLTVSNEQQPSLRKSASAAVLRNKDEEDEEQPFTPVVPEQPKKIKVIKPKPSELREMNFWSPTSM